MSTLLAHGCVGSLCRGAGCEDAWPASQVLGFTWPVASTLDVRESEAAATLSGTVDQGVDWSMASLDEAVYIGMPDIRRVVRWVPGADADDLRALPTWRASWWEFGGQLATASVRGIPILLASAPGADLDSGLIAAWTRAEGGGTQSSALFTLRGLTPGDRLGESIRTCGDLTGDGLPDWLVSAPGMDPPDGTSNRPGVVFLLPSGAGLSGGMTFPEWAPEARAWSTSMPQAQLGHAMDCSTDLTGDGVVDIVITAPTAGEFMQGAWWVLDGANLPAGGELGPPTGTGSSDWSWTGSALATGDIDGDGVGDMLLGSPGAGSGRGEVAVFYGPDLEVPRTIIEPAERPENVHLGRELQLLDLDADGRSEVVVGAEDWSEDDEIGAGRLGVWPGSAVRLAPFLVLGQDEVWSMQGTHAFHRVGLSAAQVDDMIMINTRSRGF